MESHSVVPPFVKDPKPGGCAHVVPISVPRGSIPTLVIAAIGDACHDDVVERRHIAIVYIEAEPIAWSCVSLDEARAFKAWGTGNFPSVQIVTVTAPQPAINCPPPFTQSVNRAALLDQIRIELRRLAPYWFVPATPVRRVA